jgi:hypothetical protein
VQKNSAICGKALNLKKVLSATPRYATQCEIQAKNFLVNSTLCCFYLWRHVLWTAPPFILWWWKFEVLFDPLRRSSSFIGGQRWQPGHSLHIRGKGASQVYGWNGDF